MQQLNVDEVHCSRVLSEFAFASPIVAAAPSVAFLALVAFAEKETRDSEQKGRLTVANHFLTGCLSPGVAVKTVTHQKSLNINCCLILMAT